MMKTPSAIITFAIFIANYIKVSTSNLHPVVLVPAFMASRLLYTVDRSVPGSPSACPNKPHNETLFLDFREELNPLKTECWIQSAILYYNNRTRRSYSAPGVRVTTTPFGQLDGVEYLTSTPIISKVVTYLKHLVDALVSIGYTRDVNVKAATFDWRKAVNENDEWIINTGKMIQEMYHASGGQSVIIFAHSYGNIYTHVFLNSMSYEWRAKYIRSVILVAAPLAGDPLFITEYFAPDPSQVAVFPPLIKVLPTWSTLAWALPAKAVFGDETLIKSADYEYTAGDYEKFFNDIGLPDGYQQWLDVRGLIDANNLSIPGPFSIYCVTGIGLPTIESFTVIGRLTPVNKMVLPVFGDGDSSITTFAASQCYKLGIGKPNFAYREFPGITHIQLARDPMTIDYYMQIISSINQNNERFESIL